MKFDNTRVMNFEGAFRGMRNPLESWDKSDSYFNLVDELSEHDYIIAELWARKEKPEYYDSENEEYDNENDRVKLEDKYIDWLDRNGVLKLNEINYTIDVAYIGPNDMALAQKLIKAGPEHRKFLRQIFVSVDIEAPIYW